MCWLCIVVVREYRVGRSLRWSKVRYSTRKVSNTLKLWWYIYRWLQYKFPTESERAITQKTSQHLAKLQTRLQWHHSRSIHIIYPIWPHHNWTGFIWTEWQWMRSMKRRSSLWPWPIRQDSMTYIFLMGRSTANILPLISDEMRSVGMRSDEMRWVIWALLFRLTE